LAQYIGTRAGDPVDSRAMFDRRSALRLGVGGVAATVATAALADTKGIPTQQIGAITGNDLPSMATWRNWLGRDANQNMLYFNQQSWDALSGSIPFITGLGAAVLAQGRRVQWSVPVGGPHAYAEVAAGGRNALYDRIAKSILAITPDHVGRIGIRLPWEFNLEEQTLAARNAAGQWDARNYIGAYRQIVGRFRRLSSRFYYDWCPNIGKNGIAPDSCYPGDDVVDIVSVDVYYNGKYDDQGHNDGGASIFGYRKTQPYGLDWLSSLGKQHGKLIGLSEWGIDDNRATAFTRLMTQWIAAQGSLLAYHNYWDRADGGINCRVSDGHLRSIGDIYRAAFGRH
jgi:hypothetical protein